MYDILEYLANGMTQREILEDCPTLESQDVRATLEFAALRTRCPNGHVKLEARGMIKLGS